MGSLYNQGSYNHGVYSRGNVYPIASAISASAGLAGRASGKWTGVLAAGATISARLTHMSALIGSLPAASGLTAQLSINRSSSEASVSATTVISATVEAGPPWRPEPPCDSPWTPSTPCGA